MSRRQPAVIIALGEVRILAPLFLGGLGAIAVAGSLNTAHPDSVSWQRWGFSAYALTSVAIGAMAFGHDFSHRTMVLALSQPVARITTLTVRSAVVVIMLAALATSAAFLLPNAAGRLSFDITTALLVPALGGICLAPALTLLTRSTLAGLVFGIALPVFILLGAEIVAGIRYGLAPESIQAQLLRDWITLSVFYAICALAVPAIAYLFSRTEAIDGPAGAGGLAYPAWLGRGARRHPALALLVKELHLQQGAFGFSALAACAMAPLVLAARAAAWLDGVVMVGVILHGALVALLAGALASAEERQLGTIGSQLMLPIRSRLQWALKGAVAWAVTLGLGIGLPLALSLLVESDQLRRELRNAFDEQALFPLLGVTTCALYVSTLVDSAVRALVTSLFAIAGAMLLLGSTARMAGLWLGTVIGAALHSARPESLAPDQLGMLRDLLSLAMPLIVVSWLMLAVWLARQNHESADRSVSRVARHVAWLLVTAVIGFALLETGWQFYMDAARAGLTR